MNSASFLNPQSNFTFKVAKENSKDLFKSLVLTAAIFSATLLASQAYAATVTLSVVVNTSFSLVTATNNFSTIQPGTAVFATTTLNVTTNDTAGWNVTLSGDNRNSQPQNNLQLVGATSTQIADQTEWVPGTATTSAGTAVRIGSFGASGNVLAYRVMTASSTNGAPFIASTWWGSADSYVDSATSLWAGISSTTVSRQIGNAGSGSYSSNVHVNTVLYYLNVGSSQQTGTYNAPITYTGTGN